MIITKTPFRVSLFGGGTDYPAWFKEHGGLVISTAIQKYAYISVRELPPYFDYYTRAVYSVVEHVKNNHEIQHPSIRGCLEYLDINTGLEIHYDADLPARSGIGSSSAFTVGFLHALHAFKNEMIGREELANEAIHVEQEVLKENVGVQDQIICTHGGFQKIELSKGEGKKFQVQPMTLSPDYLKSFEDHVILAFTGIHRTASDFAKLQIENIDKGANHSHLNQMNEIAKEGLSLFTKEADFNSIGDLLNKNWELKRELSNNVSNPAIDELYQIAKKAGALGGKLLGAGGGGFMMFLVPPEKKEKFKSELKKVKIWVPFSIDHVGTQMPLYLTSS